MGPDGTRHCRRCGGEISSSQTHAECGSAEQVRRMLDLIRHPYSAINLMSPPYPDVRVTSSSGRIAVEVTEVHWGVGPRGGSPTRQREEAAIRDGNVVTFSAGLQSSLSNVAGAIERKCENAYRIDGDEDFWLVLIGGSPSAPASTFIFPPFVDLAQLTNLTQERLLRSPFSRCYLFCMLAVPNGPTLYEWNRDSSWRQIIPVPTGPAPAQPTGGMMFQHLRQPTPRYIN